MMVINAEARANAVQTVTEAVVEPVVKEKAKCGNAGNMFTFTVNDETRAIMRDLADNHDINLSSLIRRLLSEYHAKVKNLK